jgi:tRNA G18 (ribose-2'-O)-methylase SpoU
LDFVFLQCTNEQCRFRFPASVEEAKAVSCPRCRSAVYVAGEALREQTEGSGTSPENRTLAGLLDNIRSIHNVGSMFRSADGAGATHLYLAGITATPAHPKLLKAALGANETIPWTYFPNGIDAAAALRAEGYQLWALERLPTAAGSVNLPEPRFPGKIALVVGNEKAGIDPGILDLCDVVLGLPMAGHKTSLNAAVAFGIALYWLQYGKMLQPRANQRTGAHHGHGW